MANYPRTFEEVVAAQDHVWLVEDRNASGIWRVEYQDDNGGCYVTIFAGPRSREAGTHRLRGVAGEAPAHDPRERPVPRAKLLKPIDRPALTALADRARSPRFDALFLHH
jgi:hypothetical protein